MNVARVGYEATPHKLEETKNKGDTYEEKESIETQSK